jgi:hypothetical protein
MKKYHPKFVLAYLLFKSGLCKFFKFQRHGLNFNFHKSVLAMNLFADKDYIKTDFDLLESHLKEAEVFIDIGANIGTWSLCASKIVGSSGKVMSFEPHPSFYSYLFDNIQLNKSTNIKSYNFGLSNERDKLYFSNNNDTMNFVQIKKEVDSIVVDVERLDEFTNELEIVDLIKIDVEGYELFVLKGGIETLKKTKKIIFESSLEFCQRFNYKTSDIIAFLADLNFKVYKLDDILFQNQLPKDYQSFEHEDLIAINNF